MVDKPPTYMAAQQADDAPEAEEPAVRSTWREKYVLALGVGVAAALAGYGTGRRVLHLSKKKTGT